MPARELSASVWTLQRAFASVQETVVGYVRRRRFERARFEPLASTGRLSICELAAHWQYADSSHFARTFKSQYGQTPAEFAPTSDGPEPGTGDDPDGTMPWVY
ncbi:helix-turn-helix domain-containing protein [Streptomyces sp. GS7]|uniref:helix-turn-helix domain-containing protein n=1 Tax=Streptomyces sp. GS7 TaxID=2692234 RepID=UPI001318D45A|nr:helix-turn-helix domain-containing protein [Streptomyces sp. GS7]QHC23280.1 helix-turn-helix domain-containing protein [Streptomyces sp. GS7]